MEFTNFLNLNLPNPETDNVDIEVLNENARVIDNKLKEQEEEVEKRFKKDGEVLGVKSGGTGKNTITAGNFLVGNGTEAMLEKTPDEVRTTIRAIADGDSVIELNLSHLNAETIWIGDNHVPDVDFGGRYLVQTANGWIGYREPEEVLSGIGSAKIVTGSYVGTGTFGKANPNTLTLSIVPKVLMIYSNFHEIKEGAMTYIVSGSTNVPWMRGKTREVVNYGNGTATVYVTWDNNKVSWHTTASSSNGREQLNYANDEYYYIAIG